MEKSKLSIEEFASFCKRKGFIYPTAEIYGGFAGFFDYGPLGVEIKNSIKNSFWKEFVQKREDIVGIDGSIITNPKVWQASGHADCFTDILLFCQKCKYHVRADTYLEDKLKTSLTGAKKHDIDKLIAEKKIKCPKCTNELTTTNFNLMLKTQVGPIEENSSIGYLRPETAQLIFINYKQVQENSRRKLPFGIAQMGKAFRNEISPRDFLFRCREFEQMEIEFFAHPDKINDCEFFEEIKNLEANLITSKQQEKNESHKKTHLKDLVEKKLASKWHAYWLGMFYKWFLDLGIHPDNLRLREHKKDELAHYAGACFDIEYNFPIGWKEIHGNADRKQFDLTQHINFSKSDLSYYDEESKTKVIPYVASEPSQGVDRAFMAFMFDAYTYDEKRQNVVLKLNPKLSPIKAGIFPLLSNKPELVSKAREVYNLLRQEFAVFFDVSGSIGRRYARMDEIGTPKCITIDFDTLRDDTINTVTVRDRDTTVQSRIKIDDLITSLSLSPEKQLPSA